MFEIQMTMEMVATLIFLTRLFHYIFMHITTDILILSYMDWIDISLWISLYVAKLFCINYVCETVSAKVNLYIIYSIIYIIYIFQYTRKFINLFIIYLF